MKSSKQLLKPILLLILMGIGLPSCINRSTEPVINTLTPNPVWLTPEVMPPLPYFLEAVFPVGSTSLQNHQAEVMKGCSWEDCGVMVVVNIDTMGLRENWDNENYSDIQSYLTRNCKLEIDEIEIENSYKYEHGFKFLVLEENLQEKLVIYWNPMLREGLHHAKFRYRTESGEIWEYTWQFMLEPE